MPLPRALRTSAFRLAAVYMLFFGLSVLGLLAFLSWATTGSLERQSDATIEAEVAGLAEQYRQRGTAGVVTVVRDRLRRDPSTPSLYLFADAQFRALAGNLTAWPAVEPTEDGWIDFSLADRARGGEIHRARARVFTLSSGTARLLVGRDMYELDRLRARFRTAAAWGLGITAVLALVGGAALGRQANRRIEAINRTSRRIMDGDLQQRVPRDGSGDELDQLAGNLNRMLDRIEQLMDGVRRVSDHIAHDLRTPLTRLRARLERLHDDLAPGAPRELAEASLGEADRLLSLFAALLRIARIESGSRLSMAMLDPAALASDAIELYDAAAEAAGVDLVWRPPPSPIGVLGDRDLLFQALANLIDNALKYTPHGGRVALRLVQLADVVELVVADTGPGIPDAEHGSVVERFARLDRDRAVAGDGLGLALVAAVARQHGGSLRFEDAHPGLRAILSLPLRAV